MGEKDSYSQSGRYGPGGMGEQLSQAVCGLNYWVLENS